MRASLFMAMFFVALFTNKSVAQRPSPASVEQHVWQLQAELEELRSRLDHVGNASSGYMNQGCQCNQCLQGLRQPSGCAQTCCSPWQQIQPEQRSRIVFGYDFVFARPRLLESFDVTVADFATGTQTLLPLDFDFDVTPRINVAFKNKNGMGLRAAYWQYDGQANPRSLVAGPATRPAATVLTVIFPATISTLVPGDVLNVSNALSMRTLDIQATSDMQFAGNEITSAIGMRYAKLDQTTQANVESNGAITQALDWNRNFNGIGILAGMDGRRPIGGRGLSAIFRGQASLLHSDKSVSRTVIGDVTPPANRTLPVIILDDTKESSAIGEVGLGLEYKRQMGRATVSVHGMYEGQIWTGIGTPALGFLGFEAFSLGVGAEY